MLNEMTYTKEEEKWGDDMCDTINADKELKGFYVKALGAVLKNFVMDTLKAHKENDVEEGVAVMNKAVDMIKALTVHMHVKVLTKQKEAEKAK